MEKKKTTSKKVNKKKIKRKSSKLILPDAFGNKDDPIAFRPGSELLKILNRLENRSEFIIKALWKAIDKGETVTCPKCHGIGVIKVK